LPASVGASDSTAADKRCGRSTTLRFEASSRKNKRARGTRRKYVELTNVVACPCHQSIQLPLIEPREHLSASDSASASVLQQPRQPSRHSVSRRTLVMVCKDCQSRRHTRAFSAQLERRSAEEPTTRVFVLSSVSSARLLLFRLLHSVGEKKLVGVIVPDKWKGSLTHLTAAMHWNPCALDPCSLVPLPSASVFVVFSCSRLRRSWCCRCFK
jgi:hypothetical protein